MKIIDLNEDNIREYTSEIGEDVAENISREYYRGVVVVSEDGEEMAAGIIWQYKNLKEQKDTESVIEWIRVRDAEAAGALFDAYSERVAKEKTTRTHVVIPVKDSSNETQALQDAGFKVRLTEGDNIVVSLSELSTLAVMKSRKVPDYIYPLNTLVLRRFRRGVEQCVSIGQTGLCEDLDLLPMTWFDPDISFYAEKDGKICGFLLFHVMPSGMIAIQLMVGWGKDFQQTILGMIRKFIITMEENYSPDTKIQMNRRNQASLLLAEKLLPRGFGIPVYAGGREES